MTSCGANSCDRFIEVAKAEFGNPERKAGALATIDYTLQRVLLLLHPFAPFVTEELWHGLELGSGSIQFAGWPQAEETTPEPRAEAAFRAVALARTYAPLTTSPRADGCAGSCSHRMIG